MIKSTSFETQVAYSVNVVVDLIVKCKKKVR